MSRASSGLGGDTLVPPEQGGHGEPGPELHHPPGPGHRGGGNLHHVLRPAAGHYQVASSAPTPRRRPCVHKQDYKFTECLRDHIHKTSNCFLPGKCSGPAFAAFFNLLVWSQEASLKNLTQSSGCLPKCSYLSYQFLQQSSVGVGWHRAWLSSFYLSPSSPSMEEVVESFLYDSSSVVGDLGSYLGLFLGWSILSLAGWLASLLSILLLTLYSRYACNLGSSCLHMGQRSPKASIYKIVHTL